MNGIWLVDRNSWDDDDDDVVDQSIHIMGNDGKKDEEHVDMNTWDSSSSDDEEAEDDDDGTEMI